MIDRRSRALGLVLAALCAASCKHGAGGSSSTVNPPPASLPGDQPAFPFAEHVDQARINSGAINFQQLFGLGDVLFETQFNELDGVGALMLPDGTELSTRFSRSPPGGGRFTGPNGQACVACHNSPFPTSAGEIAGNVLQDPAGLGVSPFNPRNAISLFGAGVLQRLAEEMTEDLLAIRAAAEAAAAPGGPAVTRELGSKGVSFGSISVCRDALGILCEDLSQVEGVDPDLVVRPYGWKGNTPNLRGFCRGAARNELGMEPDELVAKEAADDPDGDGVSGELSVGDITAVTAYVAAQEIPQPLARLVRDGLLPPPSAESGRLIDRGNTLFSEIGCAGCHVPELRLLDPVFEEPTLRGGGNYLDSAVAGLEPGLPLRFHLAREGDRPRLEPHAEGGARVALFGDLKRHNLGNQLADPQATPVNGVDGKQLELNGTPLTVPPAVFLTAELWGVGNTGPWLHDGRAGSLEGAILLHGLDSPPPPGDPDRSEAQEARDAFRALPAEDRLAVQEFLRSLVLFSFPEEEE
jgi:hypothetical protein